MNYEKPKLTGERMTPEINRDDLIYAEHIIRYFFGSQFVRNKVVLDVACGSGYGSFYLHEKGAKKVFGLDISKEAINYAQNKYWNPGIEYMVGNAENIPFKDNKFDVVISFETIEHLKNQEKFLKEMKRVMKKNGIAIISTPNALVYPKGNIFHIKEMALPELKKLLYKYFKNLNLYYQHNVLSSYILNEESINKCFNKVTTKNIKLSKLSSNLNLYLVFIMSDGKIPKAMEYVALFNDRELKVSQKELQLCQREIQNIYNSRGWKIFSFLHRVRKSIPILKNL